MKTRLRRRKAEMRRRADRLSWPLLAGASSRRGGKRLCLVYGNCQAEAIRLLMQGSSAFSAVYRTVRIPPVHEISEGERRALVRLLRAVDLVVAQPVRDGYRDLSLGTDEMLAHLPSHARIVRVAPLYLEGLFPYQLYVHLARGALGVPAPLTKYHDARLLSCFSRELTVPETRDWLAAYRPPVAAVRELADRSLARLVDREAELDVRVAGVLSQAGEPGFFTVNHPRNWLLTELCRQVHEQVGLVSGPCAAVPEYLGYLRTPVEPAIADALGLSVPTSTSWTVAGREIDQRQIVEAHARFYEARPDVLRAGVAEHRERIDMLEIS